MRIESWNPNKFDEEFSEVAAARLLEAAYVVKDKAVQNLRANIGTGKTTGISRPVYKKGKYAGQPWTAREFNALLKSVRVTMKESKTGRLSWRKRNVRVYAGHFMAYYSAIFEFTKPFMRPALSQSMSAVKRILGVKYWNIP